MPIEARDLKSRWETFQKDAVLDIIVPTSSHPGPADVASLSTAETNRLPSRPCLLFDEKASLLVVLRSDQPSELAEEWLPHLELIVTAHATNAAADGSNNVNSGASKHDIGASKLDSNDAPAIRTTGRLTQVVWATSINITRPRARLQRPAVYFTAQLALSSRALEAISKSEPIYAPSYEPMPANVLEPLRFAPGLIGSEMFLSEQRITKVAPVIQQHDSAPRPLRGVSKRAFPAMTALYPQLRSASFSDVSLADLHVEASDLLKCKVVIEQAELKIADHTAERIESVALPRLLLPGDQLGLLFQLKSAAGHVIRPAQKDSLNTAHVSIRARAVFDPDNEAELHVHWQLPMDPAKADTTFRRVWSTLPKTQSHQHDVDPGQQAGQTTSTDRSVTFNFAAPKQVIVGRAFAMQIQCVNRHDRPRSFAVWPLPSTSSVLVQTPNVKLGPVAAGACFEADAVFTAERSGVLDFGKGFSIVDLDTSLAIYVDAMPDVIAIEPDALG